MLYLASASIKKEVNADNFNFDGKVSSRFHYQPRVPVKNEEKKAARIPVPKMRSDSARKKLFATIKS